MVFLVLRGPQQNESGDQVQSQAPLFCVHYSFVSLRQNAVDSGFVRADDILSKGHNLFAGDVGATLL